MWISSRHSQAVLLAPFAMGGLDSGVTLRYAARPPLAAVSRNPVLQTQQRRVMVLCIPVDETSGEHIGKQPFLPIAAPLAGVRPITRRPQGNGGEMEPALPWQTLPAFFS